jgi:hypothetical protein
LGLVTLFLFSGKIDAPAYAQGTVLPEGNDFATRVLARSLGHERVSDISQGLNDGEVWINPAVVQNGVFTGTASPSFADANFIRYFKHRTSPTTGTINVGKVGPRYPIKSATYKCLHFAMFNDSSAFTYFLVYWFEDFKYTSGTWGNLQGGVVTTPIWKLYSVNLATFPSEGTSWTVNINQTWQGLRIDPTPNANVNFAFDWIRLTDCNAVNYTVNWTPVGSPVYLWVRPNGTTRDIRVSDSSLNGNGGSTSFDTQGMPPGQYYRFKLSISPTSCCTETLSTITINQSPIVTVTKPSFNSGVDYATQNGNPWDMASASDTPTITCTTYGFSNGILSLDTLPGSQQPGGCVGGVVDADPNIFLNVPVRWQEMISIFSFRMNATEKMFLVRFWHGMLIRWIWIIQGGEMSVLWSVMTSLRRGMADYWFDLNILNGSPKLRSSPGFLTGKPTPINALDPIEYSVTHHQDID